MSNQLNIESFISPSDPETSFLKLRDYFSLLSRALVKYQDRVRAGDNSLKSFERRQTALMQIVDKIQLFFIQHANDNAANYRRHRADFLLRLAPQDLGRVIRRKLIRASYNNGVYEIRAINSNPEIDGTVIAFLYGVDNYDDLLRAVIDNDIGQFEAIISEPARRRGRLDDGFMELGDNEDIEEPQFSFEQAINRVADILGITADDWLDICTNRFQILFPTISIAANQDLLDMFILGTLEGVNLSYAGRYIISKSLLLDRRISHPEVGAGMLGFFMCGLIFGFARLFLHSIATRRFVSRRPIRIAASVTDENHAVVIFPSHEIDEDIAASWVTEGDIYNEIFDRIIALSNREFYNKIDQIEWDQIDISRDGSLDTLINPFMIVSGNNGFWELLFLDSENDFRNQLFYRDCWCNMVMIPSEVFKDGRMFKLGGCFVRAIACSCKPSDQHPVICSCQLENRPNLSIAEVAEMCSMLNQDVCSYLVIIIIIGVRRSYAYPNKKCDVLYISPNFYENPNKKVIFINVPDWQHAQAHCAIWIPPTEYKKLSKDAEFNVFCNIGSYNTFIHKVTKRKESVCPICGKMFLWAQNISHFNKHRYNFVCSRCGLHYPNAEELKQHEDFHCKKLVPGSCILFPENKLIPYEEKTSEDVTVVYADLESAINEEGKHTTILAAWTTQDGTVSYRNSIGRMLGCWGSFSTKKILVYFHNGENYDFHFIIEALSGLNNVKKFDITADSSEKIRYFEVEYLDKTIYFRDSFSYVSTSLEKWVKVTPKEAFKIFNKTFPRWKAELLLQKNPFPYNLIQKEEDLDQPFSKIIEACDAENRRFLFCYKYEEEEFDGIKKFLVDANTQCKWETVREYYVDYLKCDVAQLADCMECFAKAVKEEYGLDIHAYYGAPSLSWAAWLKQNKFDIDLLTESEQFDIVNSSIRGGQCGAMTRYYNQEEEPNTFVMDLDANSLYATVMLKYPYPCKDWKWATPDKETLFTWLKRLHRLNRSGFIEVDLTVVDNPEFYSYVPVAQKQTLADIYDYQALYDMCQVSGENVNSVRFSGLTQTMGDIKHYCAHTRLMEWYLSRNVVKINKVYRVLHGAEEYVFRDYVKHNLEKRKEYSNDPIKKMLYKLLNNSLYGKTYEDVTARCDYGLVPPYVWEKLGEDEVKRDIMSFESKWHLYEKHRYTHQIKRPVFLGAAITEYSKLWMYIFFYDKVRPAWPNSEVLYTDTDALTIKFSPMHDELDSQGCEERIKCIKSSQDLIELLNTPTEQIIDTSNFSVLPSETLHTASNGSPGLFKSETGDAHIVKMIALRAKTYIMVCSDGTIKMSIKGCPMNEKKKITYEDFEFILRNPGRTKIIEFDAIRSKYHIVKSVVISKIVLSGDDRKRFICPDLIHTLPFFCGPYYHMAKSYETGLVIE